MTRVLNTIITFMLISSTGGLLFVFNRNIAFLIFALIIIIGLFIIGRGIKKSVYYSSLLVFIAVMLLFIINYFCAINPQSITKYTFFGITIFTTVLTLFYFNNQGSKEVFINSLYFVLKLILFHSLFSFVAYYFVQDQLFLITSKYHESYTYNYLFYYAGKAKESWTYINFFGFDLHRNGGMFWEPGILQIYLNVLLFLELSIFKRDKLLLLLILIAILTTYSTTGLLILLIQVIYFLQKEFKYNIAIIFILLFAVPLYFVVSINMSEKVYGEGEASFQKRLFDLTQPLFIALEYPLTGVGLDSDRWQEVRAEFYINSDLNNTLRQVGVEQKVETTSRGSSNSVMYMLAGMGFPTTFLFLFMFIKQQIVTKDRFICFIILFLSIMSEPLLFRPFFLIFIMSGFLHFFYKFVNHKKYLI